MSVTVDPKQLADRLGFEHRDRREEPVESEGWPIANVTVEFFKIMRAWNPRWRRAAS